MLLDKIGDYFEGVAAKYLSAVDSSKGTSHQHEIGGLVKAGFKKHLGEPQRNQKIHLVARQVYISDDDEGPTICDGMVSWYGASRRDESRPLEYRLYYKDSMVTERISEGDFFLVAKLAGDFSSHTQNSDFGTEFLTGKPQLLMVFARRGSTAENQLRLLFGIEQCDSQFHAGVLNRSELLLPLRDMLESIGIPTSMKAESEDHLLEDLVSKFGGKSFPDTQTFSAYTRKHFAHKVEPVSAPDHAIMTWMESEELLFRVYERHIVKERIGRGFEENVDEFVSFSLSVHNRRKSRAGLAFEHHMEAVFLANNIIFQRGKGAANVTENRASPDFVFPGFKEYQDKNFPASKLTMLGVKTSCKDRWRQVLSEAARIEKKHLATLEAAISQHQTDEMRAHELTLVIPEKIRATYTQDQARNILSISDFVTLVKAKQV